MRKHPRADRRTINMLKLLLLAVLATSAYGLSGSTRMCESVDVTEAWPGGYKATVSFSAPSAYSSVALDLYFIHPVGSLQMNGGTVTSDGDTHFTFSSSDSGSAGATVSYDFQTSYSEQQPLLGELTFNGDDVCGSGGGLTTDPPLANPCSGSGYEQVLCMSILFYEAQRSGPLPADQRVTWRWDSALDDGQDVGKDLTGGYYDAGDHVKFGFPLAYTGTVLAWGVIEYEAGFTAAGELANAKAAVRWVSDYLLKAHSPGELYGQVGDGGLDHAYWGRPEEMTMARPSAKISTSAPGSDLAGETAAALAAASIVFADDSSYSSACLEAARDLFSLADDHRGIYTDSIPAAAGYYNSFSGYGDELGWAAAWLYKATGEATYLDAAKGFWTEFNLGGDAVQFGWDDKKPGIYVLLSELDGGSTYTSALEGFMDRTMNEATYTPGGLVHLDTWGALRHAMNVAFIALRAADLGLSPSTYRDWAVGQLEYVLGSNGHSFVVGYGVNPPQRPHHRASSCPQYPASCQDAWSQNQPGPNPQPLYGAMVGGPDTSDGYTDDRMDYVHNEVACDYNAAFVGVLAAVVQNGL